MDSFYGEDLAYIHAIGFGDLARGAAPEIIRLLRSAATPVRRVVDVGCGSGILTAALTAARFDVTGIDPSYDLLAIAQAAAPQARFIRASIYETALPPCEAVVALGEPLTYHAPDADADTLVYKLFERIAAALPSGGMFLFDIIEAGEPPLSTRSWRSGEDWVVLAEVEEEPRSRTLTRRVEAFRRTGSLYRRSREVHTVRLFEACKVREQLEGLGFAVETAKSYGAQPLGPRRRAFFCTRS